MVTLRVCASRWTEVCGGIGSQRMQQRKLAPLLKIIIVDHRLSHLALVVQKVDSAIHRINLYPLNSAIGFPNTYPRDSDLSDG